MSLRGSKVSVRFPRGQEGVPTQKKRRLQLFGPCPCVKNARSRPLLPQLIAQRRDGSGAPRERNSQVFVFLSSVGDKPRTGSSTRHEYACAPTRDRALASQRDGGHGCPEQRSHRQRGREYGACERQCEWVSVYSNHLYSTVPSDQHEDVDADDTCRKGFQSQFQRKYGHRSRRRSRRIYMQI
jgi:hypothetical protein